MRSFSLLLLTLVSISTHSAWAQPGGPGGPGGPWGPGGPGGPAGGGSGPGGIGGDDSPEPCTPPQFYYAPNFYTGLVGAAIQNMVPVIVQQTGQLKDWETSPMLPHGLSIDVLTGVISGIPTEGILETEFLITARDDCSNASNGVRIAIQGEAPFGIFYDPNPIEITIGDSIPENIPTVTGGTPDQFSISPALPEGMHFNPQNGAVVGTPVALHPMGVYTVRAWNTWGEAIGGLWLAVNPPAPVMVFPFVQRYTWIRGDEIPRITPVLRGGPVDEFTDNLPSGINVDQQTGVISGVPQHTTDDWVEYTVTAINEGGHSQARIVARVIEVFDHCLDWTQTNNEADVVFVIDNSGSMWENQNELAASMGAFANAISSLPNVADLRFAGTTTDTNAGAGIFREYQGRKWINGDDSDFLAGMQFITLPGTGGSANERGLSAAAGSVTVQAQSGNPNEGFLRDTADLVMTVVSDENDHSSGAVQSYIDQMIAAKSGEAARVRFNALIHTSDQSLDPFSGCVGGGSRGVRYEDAASYLEGLVGRNQSIIASLCGGMPGGSPQPQTDELLQQLATVFSPIDRFEIDPSLNPDFNDLVQVSVNGSVISSSHYNIDVPGSAIVPTTGLMMEPGAEIQVCFDSL